MATHIPITGAPTRASVLPANLATEASPDALAAIRLSCPRQNLEAPTEALIAAQDVQDGDLNLEETST